MLPEYCRGGLKSKAKHNKLHRLPKAFRSLFHSHIAALKSIGLSKGKEGVWNFWLQSLTLDSNTGCSKIFSFVKVPRI
jgi:hypothetical protein